MISMYSALRGLSRHCLIQLMLVLLLAWARVGYATPSARVSQDDLEVVMGRVHESALLSCSHENSSKILSFLQPDGSFSDLPYGEDGSTAFMTHGRRQGALMYHHLAGENLAEEVLTSFTFITYDAPPNTDPGWWGHVIGTPYRMWESVVLARDILPHDLMIDFLDRYWVNTLAGAVWNPDDHSESMAGGNLGPRALYGEVEALLRGTTQRQVHAEVSQALYRELAQRQPWQDAGLRPDGCLHQHNIKGDHNTENGYLNHTLWTIYNGNYGKVMLKDMSTLMTWFTGTGLDFEDATVEGMFSAYLECQQWLFRGHTIEPTTIGRKITQAKMATQWSTQAGVLETGHNLQKLGRHQHEVEAVLHRYDHTRPLPQYALVGHKYFFNSDLSVHQRRDYMASVRILSNRTARQETWMSGANINGFFQADGFLTVLVDGQEYGVPGQEVFLVYDWARVPGVTNLYTTDIPQFQSNPYWSERFFNDAKFAGDATDGSVGLAAMVYNRPHVSLTCLKSWFFVEDLVLVLGSAITLPAQNATNHTVVTTLAQVSFEGEYVVGREGGEEVVLEGGSLEEERPAWLHHRSVGYVFLNGDEDLHVSARALPYNTRHIDLFTAWLEHGPAPQAATLAYAVLPAADVAKTRAFASHPDVQVVTLTREQHVVCHNPSKTVAVALVTGHSAAVVATCGGAGPLELWVDVPCLALLTLTSYTPEQAGVALTLADPQQVHDFLTFRLTLDDRRLQQTVQLPLPPARGSSLTIHFTL
ncbi:chondroitinase-AC-like [Panulirus ornatus]|uniref:chondroitinase-AC-like n=1 Tax=Panulirus ornatus TaxID=150431 RepID=UPI003A8B0778